MIYLDNNATTRPTPEVCEAVCRACSELWANPSSVHRAGQQVRQAVELARAEAAALIGARPRDLTFTSGGTESIHLAIRGVLSRVPNPVLVTTSVEHASIRELADVLARSGVEVRRLALAEGGAVDLDALPKALEGASIASVQWVNNETGAVQPIDDIARACAHAGVVFHCDATQWVGKMPTRVGTSEGPPIDLLSFSFHKFHGPKGVGALWVRPGVGIRPFMPGAQELGRRGGTENVPGILGAGLAAQQARAWLSDPAQRAAQAELRDRFEQAVLERRPDAVVNGPGEPDHRIWNTSNIGFPTLEAEALLILLSERGLCASAGAACSSGSLEPSPVLLAMGVPAEVAHGSIRFSLSRETTQAEIDQAAQIIGDCVERLARTLP